MRLIIIIIIFFLLWAQHANSKVRFNNVEYIRCYDADTCRFNIPGLHSIIGKNIPVRILGIDTPEIRGKCPKEKQLAKIARDKVRRVLESATRIDLTDIGRGKYFRLLAYVQADGEDISKMLLREQLAVEYHGKRKIKKWC